MSGFPTQVAFDDARALVGDISGAHRLADERIALARAHGRVLVTDVVAEMRRHNGSARSPLHVDGFRLGLFGRIIKFVTGGGRSR